MALCTARLNVKKTLRFAYKMCFCVFPVILITSSHFSFRYSPVAVPDGCRLFSVRYELNLYV